MKIPTAARSKTLINAIREHAEFADDLGNPNGRRTLEWLDSHAAEGDDQFAVWKIIDLIARAQRTEAAQQLQANA